MRSASIALVFFFHVSCFADSSFEAIVKDSRSGDPLIGATAIVTGTTIGGSSDANGRIQIHDIPDGKQTIEFSYVGYRSQLVVISFPFLIRNRWSSYLKFNNTNWRR